MSQSTKYQDRLYFEVDARNVTQAMVDDLTDRLHTLMQTEDDGVYFDPSFDSFAHIAHMKDPLKYQVRNLRCSALPWFFEGGAGVLELTALLQLAAAKPEPLCRLHQSFAHVLCRQCCPAETACMLLAKRPLVCAQALMFPAHWQCMQIGVCYQMNGNIVSYEYLCQARTRVHFVIGQWQDAHRILHSQSVQPGFMMRHPDDHMTDRTARLTPPSAHGQVGAAPATATGGGLRLGSKVGSAGGGVVAGGFSSGSLALAGLAPEPVATGVSQQSQAQQSTHSNVVTTQW